MNYKIESRQRNVAGIGGHNYLALVDDKGTVRGQIHGNLGPNGRLVFRKDVPMREVDDASHEIISGTEEEVRRVWDQMENHARDLGGDPEVPESQDSAKAIYGLLSPNSNSFWATVLGRSGFDCRDFHPKSPNWTPGTGIDLNNPVWWAPEFRWPGTAPTSADHLQKPLASYPQPARGLLSLMDEEQPPTPSPLGLLAYMDQSEMDEAAGSLLRPDVYEGRWAPAGFLSRR